MTAAAIKENDVDDVDVESYVNNSVDPEAALKELGFEFYGVNTAQPDKPCNIWRKRLKSGVWVKVVVCSDEYPKVRYFKHRVQGRGFFAKTTELDRKMGVEIGDVRKTLMNWKHEDAQEVIARLLDSSPEQPDALDPLAVLERVPTTKCSRCGSHNISECGSSGIFDCYTCGGWTDTLQEDGNDPDDAAAFINRMPVVRPRVAVTFSQTTPESSAQGDTSKTGWIDEEGEDMTPDSFDYEEGLSAADLAVKFLQKEGANYPSSSHFYPGVWYATDYHTIDYRTGTDEERCFHLLDFSEAEEREVWDKLHQALGKPSR